VGSITRGRRDIVDVARRKGASQYQLDGIALAASEALTNVVMHAYPEDSGWIHVDAWVAMGELWLLVADDGCGLGRGGSAPGLGQGLALVRRLADGLLILDRADGGTEIRMRFDLEARQS
jgi:anti-sigma regulatory factor (Ser/Thr protein kinase)